MYLVPTRLQALVQEEHRANQQRHVVGKIHVGAEAPGSKLDVGRARGDHGARFDDFAVAVGHERLIQTVVQPGRNIASRGQQTAPELVETDDQGVEFPGLSPRDPVSSTNG